MQNVVFLFLFFSGFSALIFEVSWVRECALFLGNTVQATGTVLAVFMGGLAIGAYLGGKKADQLKKDPFVVYGILEICIGIVALTVSLALKSAGDIYVWLFQSLNLGEVGLPAIRLLICVALLLLPTILMGATLPVLVRYLADHKQSGRMFSFLYGINTLGAPAGGLAACFLGFPYIGLQNTLLCAAAINVTIGALSVYLGGRSRVLTLSELPAEVQSPPLAAEAGRQAETTSTIFAKFSSAQILGIIAFMTGFTALSYEVLWTRILRCLFGSFVYSFSIMVSMFLLGLAAGSFIYETMVLKSGPARKRPFFSFSVVQLLATLACAIGWLLLPQSVSWSKSLLDLPLLASLNGIVPTTILYTILCCAPTILVPGIFIGLLFPMIGTMAASQGSRAAAPVGKVYALNTLGCVAGALVCSLFLMPSIGSAAALKLIIVLSSATGVLAACFAEQIPWAARIALYGLPAIFLAFYLSLNSELFSVAPGQTILASGEDSTGLVYVIANPRCEGLALVSNGASLAQSTPPCLRYMRLLGHLPMLLQKNPENVLVGCFGTGTTAGAVYLHPELKQLDIVELSKTVLSMAPRFHNTNYDVLKQKNVRVHVNDIRNYLLTTERSYDVITFEPPPPVEAGVVNLYTEEFYQLANKRLKQDGLLCQWIPAHEVSTPLWKMMIASARAVFPNVSIWLPNNQEAILLASKQPIHLDIPKMQARIDSRAQLKKSLQDVGYNNAMAILSTFIASGPALDEYIKGSPTITDNNPRLEFFLPYPGTKPSDLDEEAIGFTNVNDFVNELRPANGFNEVEFWKNWEAIHLLREVDKTPFYSHDEADRLIDCAYSLYPDSSWLRYVAAHRDEFYPSASPARRVFPY